MHHNLDVTIVTVGGGLSWKSRIFSSYNSRLWFDEAISEISIVSQEIKQK